MSKHDVIIIGGGLAGLACAVKLASRGVDFTILEATDRVGGRVRTDSVDGYLLDHGFQVLLTAYPAAQELLDYDRLDLQPFESGALVWKKGSFSSIDDPWRNPKSIFSGAVSNIGSLTDKIRVGLLRRDVCRGSIEDLFDRIQQPTKYRLQGLGFSDAFIDEFLRPWFGGVFLDRDLNTSSRIFEFIFRMFAMGDVAVPARGMQQIPDQLASKLPRDSIQLNATVEEIQGSVVRMTSGESLRAKEIVLATEASTTARLLGRDDLTDWNQVTCLYFGAGEAPLDSRKLVLCGDNSGPVNNFCEISSVANRYAPEGRHLLSVSVVGESTNPMQLESQVRQQLLGWFGNQVDRWEHLRTYHIPFALPEQSIERMASVIKPIETAGSPIVCGDHAETSSIQGAFGSGTRAAEAVLGRLGT